MDKNTLLAIVLSTLVLVISLFIQTKYFFPKQQQKAKEQAAELRLQKQKQEAQAKAEKDLISASFSESFENASISEKGIQEFIIKTNKAEIKFTNLGGDIISYKLLEHEDKQTASFVEMIENISDANRAFSLSFGGAEKEALNDVFNVIQKDANTVLFFRDYEIKDSAGNPKKFTLGKRYSFSPDDYLFKLDISLVCKEADLLPENIIYTLRTPPQIGPKYDKKNRYEVRQFLALNAGKKFRKNISDKYFEMKSLDWVGIGGKYFTVLVKPATPANFSNSVKVSSKFNNQDNAQLFISRNPITNETVNDTFFIYIGPRQESELIKYNDQAKNAWNLSNTKFNEALQTSGFLSWIEIILKFCLEKINLVAHNWGVSIIILTILLKIVLFPLNKNSATGSLKMQKLQPKMKNLQEKYKDDQKKLSAEMQKLYKEAGYNPMSGCLPMIVQMFILFALYNVFNNYFEFRGASFIKGWIDDLSTGDSILTWKKEIPFVSAFTMNNLRLLPFIYTASQLLNGKITQYGNPNAAGTNQGQMKFMMYGMPLMFFFLFYNVPSGLLLYWATSNVLQIGQQVLINRVMKQKTTELETKAAFDNKNALKFKGGKKKTR